MSLFNIRIRLPARLIALLVLVLLLAACAAREEPRHADRGYPAGGPPGGALTGESNTIDAAGQSTEPPPGDSAAAGGQVHPRSQEADAGAGDERLAASVSPGRVSPAEAQRRENPAAAYDHAAKSSLMIGQVCCPGPARSPTEPLDRENYGDIDTNPLHLVSEQPVSTFSIDVDTGSYSNVRRILNEGRLPPQDAVRVEELINYFDYAYPFPTDRNLPFSVNTQLARAPWNAERLLLQVGIRGYEVPASERKASNLVFLVDVSGSMQDDRKLPLLKQSLKLCSPASSPPPTGCRSWSMPAGPASCWNPRPVISRRTIEAALERLTRRWVYQWRRRHPRCLRHGPAGLRRRRHQSHPDCDRRGLQCRAPSTSSS
jgi:Ca-activated chloride channel family protein